MSTPWIALVVSTISFIVTLLWLASRAYDREEALRDQLADAHTSNWELSLRLAQATGAGPRRPNLTVLTPEDVEDWTIHPSREPST